MRAGQQGKGKTRQTEIGHLRFTTQSRARNKRGATSASLECDRARRWAPAAEHKKAATERKDEAKPCRGLPPRLQPSATTPRRPLALLVARWRCLPKPAKRAATEAKEESKKEARDAKMPAREPIRMRRAKAWNVEVENAYRFQCAGWRSAEEYAQGEYGDEISWFSDSGLVEKVQNRQGLFMYFKRSLSGVRDTSSMA